jgi:hypothetical protein
MTLLLGAVAGRLYSDRRQLYALLFLVGHDDNSVPHPIHLLS